MAAGAAVALLCSGTWMACRRAPTPPVYSGAPVVLVSIDTLRADHLPAYGYAAVETPQLDRFRKDAILYANAYSPCPMTLPSHVTMLTGLIPPEHGVRNNVGFVFDGRAHPSLPSLLKAHGYATGAAVSSYVLRGETGLAPLFDEYEDSIDPRSSTDLVDQQRPGGVTARLALRWIGARGAAPFFCFFHIYEPHVPYAPPEPFRSRYANSYDGEIAAADAIVGGLLDELRRSGVYDRAIVVVTSDHGEGLGDHGEEQHSILLYREALHVPLLLKLPGSFLGGRTADAPAELSDLMPTIARLLGLPEPKGLGGRSLLDLLGSEPPRRPIYGETLYPRLQLGWSDLRSIVDGRYHYIHGPRPELYDMVKDPGEKDDLIAREGARAARLKAVLQQFPVGPEAPLEVGAARAERLAALGYVGTVRARPASARLPNPRDSLPGLESMREGFHLASQGRVEEAAAVLAAVVKSSPSLIEAWIKLGDVLVEAGRPKEAAPAFQQALARSPVPLDDVVVSLGHAWLTAGRLAEATAAAEQARATLPGKAHELLARVALAQRHFDEAEREARAAAEASRERPSSRLILAEVLIRRGDFREALSELDGAQTQAGALGAGSLRNLDFLRADALARSGQTREAEGAYRREIRAFPGNLFAYANLAALLFAQGRRGEVQPLLQEMAAANPGSRARRLAAATWEAFGDRARAAAWRDSPIAGQRP